jgi:KDO2-lipid IV(A) lauroyltransferase
MARRSAWRRLRRATRGPRNAVLARAIAGAGRGLGALPLPATLAVGRALGAAAHGLLGTPRRLALAHVAQAFPALDPAARRRLVADTFRHAGESFAELAAFPRLLATPGYVAVDGWPVVEAILAAGRGAVAVTGHCGNWELLAAWSAHLGMPLTVVVRRVNDARFDALIVGFRRAAGVEVVGRDDPQFLSRTGDALRRGRVVAMLIDQDIQGAGVFVPFFGRLAHTPPGAAVVALRARVPVFTAFIERRPGGGHLIRYTGVPVPERRRPDAVRELTARLTAAIEAQIRRAPAEWVWWHQRWRRQPAAPPHVARETAAP